MSIYIWSLDKRKFCAVALSIFNPAVLGHVLSEKELRKIKEPIRFEVSKKDQTGMISDFPDAGACILISASAERALRPILGKSGVLKAASVASVSEPFFIFYPQLIVDCLDVDRSLIERMPSGYSRVLDPIFIQERIPPDDVVFVVPQYLTTEVYVSEKFKELAEKHQLSGLILKTNLLDNTRAWRSPGVGKKLPPDSLQRQEVGSPADYIRKVQEFTSSQDWCSLDQMNIEAFELFSKKKMWDDLVLFFPGCV